MRLRRPRGGSRTRIALLLGLLSLAVYNANLREISSQDTIPARILPVAVIMERTVTLDMFFRDQRPDAPLPYWAQRANGHYVSAYPILTPLLALPIYAVPIALLGGDSWALLNMLAKLSASLTAPLAGLDYLDYRYPPSRESAPTLPSRSSRSWGWDCR